MSGFGYHYCGGCGPGDGYTYTYSHVSETASCSSNVAFAYDNGDWQRWLKELASITRLIKARGYYYWLQSVFFIYTKIVPRKEVIRPTVEIKLLSHLRRRHQRRW